MGKTLAIAGLGNIGSMVADAALSLGMNVVGYDPKISVDAAWRLPSAVQKMSSLGDAFAAADYVSVTPTLTLNLTLTLTLTLTLRLGQHAVHQA